MNQQFFLAINGLAGKWHWLDVVGRFFGGDYFLYLFALVVVLLWSNKRLRNDVYLALGSALVARVLIVEALKRLINHPRPYEIVSNIHQLLADNEGHGMSFPSGHAVIYFSLAFAFWGTEYFWPFLILATLGSIARVFVGVHFPADIAASFLIAAFVVWLARRLFKNKVLS
jgi:undecaprenyl-diphosphatase